MPKTTTPGPADPRSLLDRALAAVPHWAALADAEQRWATHRHRRETAARVDRAPHGRKALAGAVVADLIKGKPVPDDLAARAFDAEQTGPRADAEHALLAEVTTALAAQRRELLAEHVETALDVVRAALAELIERARPAITALGDVRTAEQAVDAGPAAAAALRTVRALAVEYTELRDVHRQLVVDAVREPRKGDPVGRTDLPTWGRLDPHDPRQKGVHPAEACARYGHLATPDPVTLPRDPVELLAFLLRPGAPALAVPGPAELERRCELTTSAEVAARAAADERRRAGARDISPTVDLGRSLLVGETFDDDQDGEAAAVPTVPSPAARTRARGGAGMGQGRRRHDYRAEAAAAVTE